MTKKELSTTRFFVVDQSDGLVWEQQYDTLAAAKKAVEVEGDSETHYLIWRATPASNSVPVYKRQWNDKS